MFDQIFTEVLVTGTTWDHWVEKDIPVSYTDWNYVDPDVLFDPGTKDHEDFLNGLKVKIWDAKLGYHKTYVRDDDPLDRPDHQVVHFNDEVDGQLALQQWHDAGAANGDHEPWDLHSDDY